MQDFRSQNDIDPSVDQLHSNFRELAGAQSVSARIDRQVLAFDEALPPKLLEQSNTRRLTRIVVQPAETIGSSRLLPVQLQRPGQSRPAEQCDQLASVHHSIALSARASGRRSSETLMCGIIPALRGAALGGSRALMNDHTPLPLNLPPVARETVSAAFAGGNLMRALAKGAHDRP